MDRVDVTIMPPMQSRRLLTMCGNDEVLKAVLPASQAHGQAAPTLLEGLAMWFGRRLSVVLCADGQDRRSGLNLCDGFGGGKQTLHYNVAVVGPDRNHRGQRISGVGTFGDLQQLCLNGVS